MIDRGFTAQQPSHGALRRHLALVGMPGSGKSTLARQLSRRLQAPLIDLDQEIERQEGREITRIFQDGGEDVFRDIEARVLSEVLLRSTPSVIATGGGAILREDNRRQIKDHAVVLYLKATPEELARRLARDTTRPLLQGVHPLTKLRQLHGIRHPLYTQLADYSAETGRGGALGAVHRVLMQLELAGCVDPWLVAAGVDPG